MKKSVVDFMNQAIVKTVENMNTSTKINKYDCYRDFMEKLNKNLVEITGDDSLLVKDTTQTANTSNRVIKVFRKKYDVGVYFTLKITLKAVVQTYSYFGSIKRGNTYLIKQANIEHYNENFDNYTSFDELLGEQKKQIDTKNIEHYQEITGSAYTQFKDAVAVVAKCIAEEKEIDYFTITVLRQFGNKYNVALENLQATRK